MAILCTLCRQNDQASHVALLRRGGQRVRKRRKSERDPLCRDMYSLATGFVGRSIVGPQQITTGGGEGVADCDCVRPGNKSVAAVEAARENRAINSGYKAVPPPPPSRGIGPPEAFYDPCNFNALSPNR